MKDRVDKSMGMTLIPKPDNNAFYVLFTSTFPITTDYEGMQASWSEVIAFSQNSRMLDQLTLHTPLTIDVTKEQDLDPRP